MNRHIRVFHIWIALALLLVSAAATGGAHDGKAAAGGHQHHHSMTAEQLAELRAKIPLYREYSDEAIAAGMSRMKNSWGWVTETPAGARVGVLALAHGFKETGNRQFAEAYAGAANDYPKAYAFGMAMMTSEHIQSAIDALQDNGAEIIVVMPTTTADNTTLVRQWDYIFGKRDESAYLDVARVRSDAELIWAPTPTGDPLVAEIMLDYARELSRDPSRELVIIMGHGPQDSADNERELEILNRHAAFIRKQGGFSEVRAANVQDDAPTGVRAANVEMIRGWAEAAEAEGRRTIVVHTALTQSGVVGRMARDVEGVAEFNSKGLMQHPLFGQWIDNAIARTLASAQ
jgi:hypothetical protein